MPAAEDRHEFEAALRTVDAMDTKAKRHIYSAVRSSSTRHTFLPKFGLTLGQVSTCLVIREKAG